jgi:hypothetical protein
MVKVNDTTTFPITTPALDDLLFGTDVSNTSASADGETVNFTPESILNLSATRTQIYAGATVQTVESSDLEDGYYYRWVFDGVTQDGSNSGGHYLAMDFMKASDSSWVGSTYSSYLPIAYTSTQNAAMSGAVTLFMPRVNANHFSVLSGIDSNTGNTSTFTAKNSITSQHAMGGRVYVGATETKIKRVRFWTTDAVSSFRSLVGGKIYEEKIRLT